MIWSPHKTLFGWSNKKNGMGGACGTHVAEERDKHMVWWGRPEGKRPLGRPRPRWEDDIRMDLQEMRWGAWSGFTWFRIRTGGGLL